MLRSFSPVPNNRGGWGGEGGGLNKRWGPTGNLNINKWGCQNKRGRSEKCSRSKVSTRYH